MLAAAIEEAGRIGYGWSQGLAAHLLARSWLAAATLAAHDEPLRAEGPLTLDDMIALLPDGPPASV